MKISAILLAAGLSQRMGCDKLLLDYKGRSLLQIAVDLLSELSVFERILVTTDSRLQSIALPPNIHTFVNSTPENGVSGSILIGLNAASGSHYLFMSSDQPKITSPDLTDLLELVALNPEKIVFPCIDSIPCSPTLFPASFRSQLLGLSGDIGGRALRDANSDSCLSFIPENPLNFIDIDNMEDYRRSI